MIKKATLSQLAALLLTLLLCDSCSKSSCDKRDPIPIGLSITSSSPRTYAHIYREPSQYAVFPVGQELSISPFTSGLYLYEYDSKPIVLNDTKLDILEKFTIEVGSYTAMIRASECNGVKVLDNKENSTKLCGCLVGEDVGSTDFTVVDTTTIEIDSILLTSNLDCLSGDCESITVVLGGETLATKQLNGQEKLEWSSDFRTVSAPEITGIRVKAYLSDPENTPIPDFEHLVTSRETNDWSEGWHTVADQALQIYVRRPRK